jgi:hypothetical protein
VIALVERVAGSRWTAATLAASCACRRRVEGGIDLAHELVDARAVEIAVAAEVGVLDAERVVGEVVARGVGEARVLVLLIAGLEGDAQALAAELAGAERSRARSGCGRAPRRCRSRGTRRGSC